MRMSVRSIALLAAAAVLAAFAGTAGAQRDKPMSAEEKKAMETWMKYATPGPNHKLLDPFVGSWQASITSWEAPGAAPQMSVGTSENVWVLGGRFVQQTVSGSMMGQSFSGIGYTGYDNYEKQFVATWMDSMGTMVLLTTGQADASGRVLTMTGKLNDIIAGKTVTTREVTRVIDNNHVLFEMYGPDPSGREFKVMEIAYTRK
jgi:hypothetical protein